MTEETRTLKVLFAGLSVARVVWYRCVLPAMYMGADWAGLAGTPPNLRFATGFVQGATQAPNLLDYDVVVVQQARGKGWHNAIREMRDAGVTVLYEIDDYVHGIRKLPQHDFARFFQKEHLAQMELCMRACDGMIVSTDFLAAKYRRFARGRVWVCKNGLDLPRYAYTLPERGDSGNGKPTRTMLWTGATGHGRAVASWAGAVHDIMARRPETCFVSIGQRFAEDLKPEFGDRVLALPFGALEAYPAAMTVGDVSLAPLGQDDWNRAKSDLRVMEASALGIPSVADPHYEESLIDGHTGFIARTGQQARGKVEQLLEDDELRLRLGENARTLARAQFGMATRVEQWKAAIAEAWGNRNDTEARVAA